jgi:hypothetical protein
MCPLLPDDFFMAYGCFPILDLPLNLQAQPAIHYLLAANVRLAIPF